MSFVPPSVDRTNRCNRQSLNVKHKYFWLVVFIMSCDNFITMFYWHTCLEPTLTCVLINILPILKVLLWHDPSHDPCVLYLGYWFWENMGYQINIWKAIYTPLSLSLSLLLFIWNEALLACILIMTTSLDWQSFLAFCQFSILMSFFGYLLQQSFKAKSYS